MRSGKRKNYRKLKNSAKLFRLYIVFTGIGLLCVISGFILIFSKLSYAKSQIKLNNNSPVRLIIPSLRVYLPIVESEIVGTHWQISPTDVNHLVSSSNPGENNNIVIYGHNKWEILGKLKDLEIGAQIDIKTVNGQIHTYQIFDKKEVNQYAVAYIKPTNTEMLTIFTCSGWFDSKRLIIQAKPIFHS